MLFCITLLNLILSLIFAIVRKVGTNFADKLRLLGRYTSLTD
jgi:hypothetical protein